MVWSASNAGNTMAQVGPDASSGRPRSARLSSFYAMKFWVRKVGKHLACCRMLRSRSMACGMMRMALGPRRRQVRCQRIQHNHGKFFAPAVDLIFFPMTVQPDGIIQIFRKRQPEAAFTSQDVADLPPGMHLINPARRVRGPVQKCQKHFARIPKRGMVEPRLLRIHLWTCSALGGEVCALDRRFVFRIEIQDALAGFALDDFVPGANVVICLRTQHDAARHALLVTYF